MESTIRPVSTIPEFCKRYGISRTHFYVLVNSGQGPALMSLGRARRITEEAEVAWRARVDSPASAPTDKVKAAKPSKSAKRTTSKRGMSA